MSNETVKWGKSPAHRAKISAAMLSNLNALKHSRYSRREKPAATCAFCPMASRCPRYRRGGACVFIWEQVAKMEALLHKTS